VALEIAGAYAAMEAVYRSGFIDTAEGTALENVVALLGISRISGGRGAGEVEFRRAPGAAGTINIPAGVRVATANGKIDYETTEPVTMAAGQDAIRVTARDLNAKNDPLPAGALAILPAPIVGIAGVSNPGPTARSANDETDEQLRARAKNILHGSERATLGALQAALAAQAISADIDELTEPGRVEITPHVDTLTPEARQRLLSAIEAVRPAGVLVILRGAVPPRKVNLELRLTTKDGMLLQDARAAQHAVQDKVAEYFAALPAKSPGSINKIIGVVQSVSGVEDVSIVSATWNAGAGEVNVIDTASGQLAIGGFATVLGDLKITDPALPVLLDVVVTYPDAAAPPDQPAIQAAFNAMASYVSDLNSKPLAAGAPAPEQQKRVLSYGKLARVTPLPNKPGATLDAFDAAPSPPPLPTAASIAPYQASFVFTLESGVSRVLAGDADPAYALAPFERVAIGSVQVAKGAGGA
jgi:hypothetical protein